MENKTTTTKSNSTMMETNIKCRMLQICDELKAEGYRVTGSLGETINALKHPNGNRMTIIYADGKIGYIKNGTLKKSETVEKGGGLPVT